MLKSKLSACERAPRLCVCFFKLKSKQTKMYINIYIIFKRPIYFLDWWIRKFVFAKCSPSLAFVREQWTLMRIPVSVWLCFIVLSRLTLKFPLKDLRECLRNFDLFNPMIRTGLHRVYWEGYVFGVFPAAVFHTELFHFKTMKNKNMEINNIFNVCLDLFS